MTKEQEQILEILKSFSKICERYHLQYYLGGGTLLGAVRHHGFIPWDDDIDVMMPWEDYHKLISLQNVFTDGLSLQSRETDNTYPLYFCKLCNTNIPFKTQYSGKPWGVYIDIFPLVPSRKPSGWSRAVYNLQHIIVYVLQVRAKWQDFIPYKKWYAQVAYRLLDLLSEKQLKQLQSCLIHILIRPNAGYFLSPGGAYKADKEFYPQEWMEDSVEVCFEGEKYPAPIGWHEYLSRNYGDYMKMPPLEERISRHK